ncbi:MAG: CCA tRNA nucleotidyltransferase [Ignavibacteriales bacterium]
MLLPGYVIQIIETIERHGFQAYLVGGCVRDMILDRQPRDYDIVTSAEPVEITRIFAKTLEVGAKFGTIIVVMDGQTAEISSFRGHSATGGSAAEILEDDLSRRDFTINAIAMDLKGKLYDPWGGQTDIRRRLVRATRGEAAALFTEDPLRMMRAVRLCVSYGFDIESSTLEAITKLIHLIPNVSVERIRDELNEMLASDEPSRAIRMMHQSGILNYVLPEVEVMFAFDQRNPRHDRDLFEHTLAVVDGVPNKINLRLGALLHDIAKPICFTVDESGRGHFYGHAEEGGKMAEAIMRRLKYDNQSIEEVKTLVAEHMSQFAKPTGAGLKRLINRVSERNMGDLFSMQRADIKASAPPHDYQELDRIIEETANILSGPHPMTVKDLAVNGHDLMKIGFAPGPELGKTLNHLLLMVFENPDLNRPDLLLDLAKSLSTS